MRQLSHVIATYVIPATISFLDNFTGETKIVHLFRANDLIAIFKRRFSFLQFFYFRRVFPSFFFFSFYSEAKHQESERDKLFL